MIKCNCKEVIAMTKLEKELLKISKKEAKITKKANDCINYIIEYIFENYFDFVLNLPINTKFFE